MRSMQWVVPAMAVVLMSFLMGCGKDNSTAPASGPTPTVVTATGNITTRVNDFRTALGPPNGGTPGEQQTGRREINWDGAAANPFDNRNDFPADFFNTTVKAGSVYATPGTGLRNDSTLFAEVNPTYATQFNFFSPNKIFAAVGSNQMDFVFEVAGQPTAAVVNGFGVVFSDVDMAGRTTIQLFAKNGSSLGVFAAPVRSDAAGFSFLGVTFADPVIARARITLGTAALGAGVNDVSSGGTADLVVLDNVIYGEPHASH